MDAKGAHCVNRHSTHSTLAELPIHEFAIDERTPMRHIKQQLESRSELPGVIILRDGDPIALVARDAFFAHLSRPFRPETFLDRPIRAFAEQLLGRCQLQLSSECTIHQAAELALSRPLAEAYAPILVRFDDGRCGMVDVYTVLMAQSQMLALAKVIEEQKEAAEAANQAKSEFLANMSHELRTPLHGILSYAQFGLDDAGTNSCEELQDYFQRIEQCSQTLLSLVNDLLDLSKLESGKHEFRFEGASFAELVDAVVDEFNSICSTQHVTIEFQPPDCDTFDYFDVEKIKQVIRNLISNAVKFSPANGTVTVRLRCVSRSLLLSVRDRGPGIPEDELETIFDKFVQSSKTKNGGGGTGLGLAICREIVAGHDGRLWAENATDEGSILYCELPLDVRQPAPPRQDLLSDDPSLALK